MLMACAKPSATSSTNPPANPTPATALEINQRLGRGINLGNMYEGDVSWQGKFEPGFLRLIAEQGFKHVRVPIRWERADRSMLTPPYTIQPSFINEIKNVVDEALKNKLHVIINMHHHDNLLAKPAEQKERFLSQWQQISNYFKSYPDSLLFEILNEPNGNMTATLWNEYAAAALNTIRQTNATRTVLIGTPDWGGVASVDKLALPNDQHLILTVHYYNPFNFTHQGADWVQNSDPWLGTKWYDTRYERADMESDFKKVLQVSREKNIPVHVGEFGAYSKADMDSRVRWTRFLARWFEQQKFSWAYWEFNSGFGIYDNATKQFRQPLLNALTRDEMPNAYDPPLNTLYTSNFTGNQKDGWNIYNNDVSAASTMVIVNEKINVTITQPGAERWHVQLMRPGSVNLEAGKMYRITFNASADGTKTIGCDISKHSSPWTVYSGSRAFNINTTDTEYSFIFYASQSDAAARIAFSIGNSGTGSVILHNIHVQQVQL